MYRTWTRLSLGLKPEKFDVLVETTVTRVRAASADGGGSCRGGGGVLLSVIWLIYSNPRL
jgi:hypothetical protein